jgi:hypothetical protein
MGNHHPGAIPPELLLQTIQAVTDAATGTVANQEQLPPAGVDQHVISEMLDAIERTAAVDEIELARLEWIWLPALEHTERGPATLRRIMMRDPAFFANVIGMIYRPRFADCDEEPVAEVDERTQEPARQARQLLQEWHGVPGRREDGEMEAAMTRQWVEGARAAFRSSGHVVVGDIQIGRLGSQRALYRARQDDLQPEVDGFEAEIADAVAAW